MSKTGEASLLLAVLKLKFKKDLAARLRRIADKLHKEPTKPIQSEQPTVTTAPVPPQASAPVPTPEVNYAELIERLPMDMLVHEYFALDPSFRQFTTLVAEYRDELVSYMMYTLGCSDKEAEQNIADMEYVLGEFYEGRIPPEVVQPWAFHYAKMQQVRESYKTEALEERIKRVEAIVQMSDETPYTKLALEELREMKRTRKLPQKVSFVTLELSLWVTLPTYLTRRIRSLTDKGQLALPADNKGVTLM